MLVLGCSSLSLLGSSTLVTKLHANHVWHIFKCFTAATHHIVWLRRWYHHAAVTPRLWHSLFCMTWKKVRKLETGQKRRRKLPPDRRQVNHLFPSLLRPPCVCNIYIWAPGMTGSIVSYRTDQEHALWIAETKLVLSLRQI